MTNFHVDTSRIESVVKDIDSYITFLKDQISTADSTVNSLGDAWAGSAQEAQKTAHAEWSKGATEVVDALQKLKKSLELAKTNYDGADTANTTMWG